MKIQDLETIDELASRWRVGKCWLYHQTMQHGPGTIPRIKIGRYLRFFPSDVDEWLLKRQETEEDALRR